MTNDIELAAIGQRATKVRLIAQGIYDAKERGAIIDFASDAEKMAAELSQANAREPWFAMRPLWVESVHAKRHTARSANAKLARSG